MTTTTRTASEQIADEVDSWPGVTSGHGSRSEFFFKVGRREIGHLHGDYTAHFGFPARAIEDADDVQDVIALLRINYERVVARYGLAEDVS